MVDFGYAKHFRVYHVQNEFAKGNKHINGTESFLSYAKQLLVQFNGMSHHMFYFYLKEIEFGCNHQNDNLYQQLFRLLRENPLFAS